MPSRKTTKAAASRCDGFAVDPQELIEQFVMSAAGVPAASTACKRALIGATHGMGRVPFRRRRRLLGEDRRICTLKALPLGRIYGHVVAVHSDDTCRAQLSDFPSPQLRYWTCWPVCNVACTWTGAPTVYQQLLDDHFCRSRTANIRKSVTVAPWRRGERRPTKRPWIDRAQRRCGRRSRSPGGSSISVRLANSRWGLARMLHCR